MICYAAGAVLRCRHFKMQSKCMPAEKIKTCGRTNSDAELYDGAFSGAYFSF